MDDKLAVTEKKVLVDIVKLVQRRGMKGAHGDWKGFLSRYDKKFGASLSDPAKRSNDVLVSFLKTFTDEEDSKFLDKVLQCRLNRNVVEKFTKESLDDESPEQRLVRLTLEHPLYPLDYAFPSHDEEWVVTKLSKKSKVTRSNAMVAVDCEMVHCEDGTDALVRVCVVDHNLQVKLDELVNPNKVVADYRTEITGVTARDLDGVTCSLPDIQKSMKKLLSHGTILVGHSLNNDLRALKIDHARVIDTAFIFKYSDGPVYRRPSLNNLCKSVLGYEIRKKSAPHNCLDDACAAMKLVLAKIERGVDSIVPLVQEVVPESELAKLLLHKIPINVPSEDLYRVIPGDFTIALKHSTKAQGEKYSAFAIFKDPQEAHKAFEIVQGNQEKDSSGRPQKLVTFKLNTGITASLYVRKMAHNYSTGQVSALKRAFQGDENSNEYKKLKTDQEIKEEIMADSNQCDNHLKEIEVLKQELREKNLQNSNQCDDHLKEIERLKQELRNKDFFIAKKDEMISNLKKKLDKVKEDKKKNGR